MKRRGEARRGEARRSGGKKSSAQKMPNAQSAFHNSRFLPPFLPSFLPSRPVIRLPGFPSTVFLSSSCLVRRPRPPSARLVLIRASEGEGPLVAKKLGYFATFHVDKLRLAQSVLGWREAAERPGRRGIRAVQGSISSRSLSLSLSSPLTVLNESRRRRRDRSAIRCRFRPRFYECLSDCHKFWGRRPRARASAQWLGTLRLAGRSVGVCRALLEFQ